MPLNVTFGVQRSAFGASERGIPLPFLAESLRSEIVLVLDLVLVLGFSQA
jgi:hypothetical protein